MGQCSGYSLTSRKLVVLGGKGTYNFITECGIPMKPVKLAGKLLLALASSDS
jgi:hypothetical protein